MKKSYASGEHYFAKCPTSPRQSQLITAWLRGMPFRFHTDQGVFAKDYVDAGTRRLVETMELPEAGDILDWGCGYGVVGIVAASLCPAARIWMVDINERAVELARRNVRENRLRNVVVVHGDGFHALPNTLFDAILSNPPVRAGKQVIFALMRESWERLRPGGALWLVGMTRQGAKSWQRLLCEIFGNVNVEVADRHGGYRVLKAVKSGAPTPVSIPRLQP